MKLQKKDRFAAVLMVVAGNSLQREVKWGGELLLDKSNKTPKDLTFKQSHSGKNQRKGFFYLSN